VKLLERVSGWAIIAIGLLISALFIFRAVQMPSFTTDFTVMWTAGDWANSSVYHSATITEAQRWLTEPANSGPRPFAYPPSALLLFEPLGQIPFAAAYAGWCVLLLVAFAYAAREHCSAWWLAALAPPVVFGIWGGQPSILIAVVLLWGVPRLSDRPYLVGALLGLCAAIKPQCVLLVPVAIIAAKEWRPLAAFIGAGVFAVALSVARYGFDMWASWLSFLPEFRSIIDGMGLNQSGVSPASIGPALGLGDALSLVIQCLGIAAGLALVIWGWAKAEPICLPTLLIGGLLVSPYAMPYELAALMPLAVSALRNGNLLVGLSYTSVGAAFTLPLAALGQFLLRPKLHWQDDRDLQPALVDFRFRAIRPE
jgi:hypothetical protein